MANCLISSDRIGYLEVLGLLGSRYALCFDDIWMDDDFAGWKEGVGAAVDFYPEFAELFRSDRSPSGSLLMLIEAELETLAFFGEGIDGSGLDIVFFSADLDVSELKAICDLKSKQYINAGLFLGNSVDVFGAICGASIWTGIPDWDASNSSMILGTRADDTLARKLNAHNARIRWKRCDAETELKKYWK